jgi:hypothetical protein
MAAPYGIRAWRQVMKWDGTTHRKMWVRVKKLDRCADVATAILPRHG